MLKPKIFISYRRTDSSAFAGRISDRLQNEFGEQAIFIDVDSIDAGDNYSQIIKDAVSACDVFLAIMGKGWATTADSAGKLRLHEPEDQVRQEVSLALQTKVTFFPVLVDGAAMPEKESLPLEIQQMEGLNAIRISHEKFGEDISLLIVAISNMAISRAREGVNEILSKLRGDLISTTSPMELERISHEVRLLLEIDPTNFGAKQLQKMVLKAREYHDEEKSGRDMQEQTVVHRRIGLAKPSIHLVRRSVRRGRLFLFILVLALISGIIWWLLIK